MKYVYLLYRYMPKHKYASFIYDGRYLPPIVCKDIKIARTLRKKWKHCCYIRKVKLHETIQIKGVKR